MNKYFVFIIFCLLVAVACKKEKPTKPTYLLTPDPPPRKTQCEISRFSCDSILRKGKWVEYPDKGIGGVVEDTLYFVNDTLMGFTSGDFPINNPYRYTKYWFSGHYIYYYSWWIPNSDPTKPTYIFTTYNDTTKIFYIHWGFSANITGYKKLQ